MRNTPADNPAGGSSGQAGASTQPAAGGEARNHHYVPQCYLKGFARNRSKNSQLYVVDGKMSKAFPTTPRNVAAQRDFNRVEIPGEDPNLIEASYADFEAKVAPALVRLDQARAPTSQEDLALVLELVGLLAVRNPGRRESMRRFHAEVARRIMDLTLASRERWEGQVRQAQAAGYVAPNDVTFEQMRDFVREERYTIEVPTTRHVQVELQMLETVVGLLHQRRWALLCAAPGTGGFVTSDQPVTLRWNDESMQGGFYPPGFGMTGTTVYCPLSKELTLVGTFDGATGAIESTERQIAAVNSLTIGHAGRQIYAESDRFRFLDKHGILRHGGDLLTAFVA